jgi:hypothetical protein
LYVRTWLQLEVSRGFKASAECRFLSSAAWTGSSRLYALQRIQVALKALLSLIGRVLTIKYLAMDGHFGNFPAA